MADKITNQTRYLNGVKSGMLVSTISNGSSYSYSLVNKFGILVFTVRGANVERMYIVPVYVVNQYCKSVGNEIMNYAYNTNSSNVTFTFSGTDMVIQNNSGTTVSLYVAYISNG